MLSDKLKSVQASFDTLAQQDIVAFNSVMHKNDLAGISVPPAAAVTFAPPQRSMFGDFPTGADVPANPNN